MHRSCYISMIVFLFLGSKQLFSQNWQPLGTGMENSVMAVCAAPGDTLLAGGRFYTSGGKNYSYLAAWSENQWKPMGKNLDNTVKSIVNIDGTLFFGGEFSYAGDSLVNCFARWDGEKMVGYQQGFFKSGQHAVLASVNAITRFKNQLYVGGLFDYGNSKQDFMYNMARWNGQKWEEVGGGLSGTSGVNAMMVYHDTLYVAGGFNLAGDTTTAKYVAKWDGSNWYPVGKGMNNEVNCFAIYNDQLYAGGVFTQADGKPIANIARWNGATWEAVGGGINNSVYSLKTIYGRLYAGGYFNKADGNTCNNLAYWDGSTWHSAGNPNGVVWCLADAGYLVAGGNFTTIGGNDAKRIAFDKSIVSVSTPEIEDHISFYPNPANEKIHFNSPFDKLTIHALNGQQYVHTSKKDIVDVSELAEGLYMIVIETAGKSQTQRLQIIR